MLTPEAARHFKVLSADSLEPEPGGTIDGLSNLGYRFAEAVAEVTDNSLDFGAKNLLIRIQQSETAVTRIYVADDGAGMDADELKKGMKFGNSPEARPGRISKYGMGMKIASFSQCKALTVLSRTHSGNVVARRWSLHNIAKGWLCENLDPAVPREILDESWGPVSLRKHGTLVIWDDLRRTGNPRDPVAKTIDRLERELGDHLGMVYHRFLSTGRAKILMHVHQEGQKPNRVLVPITALNPFGYTVSGKPSFPKTFTLDLGAHGTLPMRAHIWPPNLKTPEYRLGGRTAARQGFYFYRNDRLIIAGGWFGYLQQDSEPHKSLARVEVDLPERLDAPFNLGLRKTGITPPDEFIPALEAARSGRVSFSDYVQAAEAVYRRKKKAEPGDFPSVPGDGFPVKLRNRIARVLAQGEPRVREVTLKWTRLPDDTAFDIDRQDACILLNTRLKGEFLERRGLRDRVEKLLKLLMFFMLREELDKKKASKNRRQRLDCLNSVFVDLIGH